MSYVLVGVAASLVGFMGGFLFGSINGAKFAHQALMRAGRLKDVPPPTKVNQDFQ